MIQQKIDNLSALSKYRSELMGIAIIWIVLFHSLSVEFFSERNQGFLVYTSHCNLLSVVSLILSNW